MLVATTHGVAASFSRARPVRSYAPLAIRPSLSASWWSASGASFRGLRRRRGLATRRSMHGSRRSPARPRTRTRGATASAASSRRWSFDEPNWESGRNVWWRFQRADGTPWGLAGLWNTWTDKATGESIDSYTMLTINADAHPLMRRMHKPDPKLVADQQDKRSLVAIEFDDVDQWLYAPVEEAAKLVKLTPAEMMDAGAAELLPAALF